MNSFTVEQFLSNTTIKGLKLVAGESGVKNTIFNANIIDNPDSYEWFTAGDFLLTTGYIFQHDETLQKQLIVELSEMNCAGLGIKIHRYWDKVPETILLEANKVGLPIIEIPYVYSLAQVTNYINHTLSNRENSLLHKYKSIHEVFNRALLEDGDFFKIAKVAADLIKNPVILVDSRFNLLSYAELKDNPKALDDHLNLMIGSRLFTKEFTQDIPTSTDLFTLSIKRKFPDKLGSITCRIIPIAYGKDLYGYLIAWETMRKLESIDYVALETAATTAAIRQIKLLQIEESHSRMRDSFFDDLLQDRIISINNVEALAKMHGLSTTSTYVIAIVDTDVVDAKLDVLISDVLLEEASKHKTKIQLLKRLNNFILFIELLHTIDKTKQDVHLRTYLNAVALRLKNLHDVFPFKIGVGSECEELHTISKSYTLAQEVLHLSEKISSDEDVLFFNDLIGYHLLQQNIKQSDLLRFFNQTLGDLYNYDIENGGDLLKTLDVYFQNNANLSEASKAMYVHRNTFIYRLEKIKKILNSDLKNAEENFIYSLALHIKRIINI